MASDDDVPNSPRPFNVETVRYLVELMSEHDLSEVDLREGELRIRLRRGPEGVAMPMSMPALAPSSYLPAASAASSGATAAAVPAAEPAAPAKHLIEIKSPMVGTFYAKPKPDAKDYVEVGSRVKPESIVCQIEAMKLFNEIKAECSGVIVEVLVKNAQPVEYNTVLFRVDPTG